MAIDSQLATASSITAVHELLNGCICCNLVGQLGPALSTLHDSYPTLDRIVIETSGSAFPATLAMEINRLARETEGAYVLDGVVSVVDVENWQGYEDTSYTAKMQARYTDLVVLNKWERVGERRVEDVVDRVGDLEVPVAIVKSERGKVGKDVLLGLDGKMAGRFETEGGLGTTIERSEGHEHGGDHSREVEVLSISLLALPSSSEAAVLKGVNLESLETFLLAAPKDEIYRIKAIIKASSPPASSDGEIKRAFAQEGHSCTEYILNWAFGRWTFTPLVIDTQNQAKGHATNEPQRGTQTEPRDPLVKMTIVTARGEADAWKRRIETQGYIEPEEGPFETTLEIKRTL